MAATIPLVSRISTRIIRVLGCNPGPMTLQGTNTYLIGTGKRRILLDAGEPNIPSYIENLNNLLKEEQVDLEHIIITHWHNDHIGGLEDVLANRNKDCSVWKMKRTDKPDQPLPHGFLLNYLEDGQEITTAGATLRVVHTPGHSTDHIVLALLEENSLFSGDCILGEGTAVFEDLYDYMASLNKILGLAPRVIYPGHGNIIQDPLPKIQYYIAHRFKREQEILKVLQQDPSAQLSAMELVKIIYTETPESLHPAAAHNVDHHLNKLLRENKVRQVDGRWKYNKLASPL